MIAELLAKWRARRTALIQSMMLGYSEYKAQRLEDLNDWIVIAEYAMSLEKQHKPESETTTEA